MEKRVVISLGEPTLPLRPDDEVIIIRGRTPEEEAVLLRETLRQLVERYYGTDDISAIDIDEPALFIDSGHYCDRVEPIPSVIWDTLSECFWGPLCVAARFPVFGVDDGKVVACWSHG